MRLAEHDGDLLHWFYDEGFVPGAVGRGARAAEPAAGQLTVRLNGDEQTIGEKAAAGLFVRPAAQAVAEAVVARRPARSASALSVRSHGEVVVVAAEVAVRGGLRVDRAPQVEVAQDRGRTQVEVLLDQLLDPRGRDRSVPNVCTPIETGAATPIA